MQGKTPNNFLKLAIVGKGAIGGLIGFKCHKLGYDYQHLIKTPQQSLFKVTDIAGDSYDLIPNTSVITKPAQFDLLILPVKAYQVMPVLDQLQAFIQPRHIIVLLHNGMGTIEQVKEKLPNNPLVAATTTYSAFKPDKNTLIETGFGQTHLGWLGNIDTALKQSIEPILSALFPPSHWHQDIGLALWKKLAINAVINPLTAIHNVKNGRLADKKFHASISNICGEVAKVMMALDYSINSAELIDNVQKVIKATANNYSSMHQDLKLKRHTEIAFINGYITCKAAELNIEVPHNQQLVEQVKQLV
ncbi:MAG: 2-dehydropantoate 2-reductase [Flavobacteriales bacterium]|jgi:2-dehydropantoate 2-reductase